MLRKGRYPAIRSRVRIAAALVDLGVCLVAMASPAVDFTSPVPGDASAASGAKPAGITVPSHSTTTTSRFAFMAP